MYVDAQTIITWAAALTAMGVIGGLLLRVLRFIEAQKKQDVVIEALKNEQRLLTEGVLACLKGLKEQGCNGPVTKAVDKIENYLNEQAHK